MFLLGNLFLALAKILELLLTFLIYLVFFRAIISWVSPDPYNPIVQFLYRTTEPVLKPIRRFIPMGGVDFSPIIAFIIIMFLQFFFVASLRDWGYHMHQPKNGDMGVPGQRPSDQQIPLKAESMFR